MSGDAPTRVLAVCRSGGGLPKIPVAGPVAIGPGGVDGDAQRHRQVHGGPDQAVLVYAQADYDRWRAEGFVFPRPGAMGENLLIAGLEPAELAVGDHLVIGAVRLELTAPRAPCANLAIHHPDLPRLVRETGRGGVYCRVLAAGRVAAGDPVRHERRGRLGLDQVRA
ncbi:MAG TPA: MOSC domain-containing protein, partial [Thermodesulfobacteriota bacterium]|nr:MOSC domain-containing protein [Thermodesulfobacteriota bacterium]